MRKFDEYLVTIDTIYKGRSRNESPLLLSGQLRAPAAMPFRLNGLGGVLDRVENWLARRKGRRALLDMSGEQLHDIGISRADATREAAKSLFLAR